MARFASSVPTCPLREKATDQDRFFKAEKEKFMKTKTGNIESGEICYHESCTEISCTCNTVTVKEKLLLMNVE